MIRMRPIIFLALVVGEALTAPQFITFKDGNIGVNFGGYRASAGLGGLLTGDASAGGLQAEAGTPWGQMARAGLGGRVNAEGKSEGSLYAGATAGKGVSAAAGLGGAARPEGSQGAAFAGAEAGGKHAGSVLTGHAVGEVIDEGEAPPVVVSKNKKIYKTYEETPVLVRDKVKQRIVEPIPVKKIVENEIYVTPQPVVIHKSIIHEKRRLPPAYKAGWTSNFNYEFSDQPPPVVAQKRVDVNLSSRYGSLDDIAPPQHAKVKASAMAKARVVPEKPEPYYIDENSPIVDKTVTFTGQRPGTFFSDIFNIPISTLQAVGKFLGNSASGTNLSVQKEYSVYGGNDESNGRNSAGAENAGKVINVGVRANIDGQKPATFIQDIIDIPINTLGAVNRFLVNNVPPRKHIQTVDGEEYPVRLRSKAERRRDRHRLRDEIYRAQAYPTAAIHETDETTHDNGQAVLNKP